jgi:hypothetical protein
MNLTRNLKNVKIKYINQLKRRNKMAVANALYKVGDTFTTQKSKVTGTITEIIPQANGNVTQLGQPSNSLTTGNDLSKSIKTAQHNPLITQTEKETNG